MSQEGVGGCQPGDSAYSGSQKPLHPVRLHPGFKLGHPLSDLQTDDPRRGCTRIVRGRLMGVTSLGTRISPEVFFNNNINNYRTA